MIAAQQQAYAQGIAAAQQQLSQQQIGESNATFGTTSAATTGASYALVGYDESGNPLYASVAGASTAAGTGTSSIPLSDSLAQSAATAGTATTGVIDEMSVRQAEYANAQLTAAGFPPSYTAQDFPSSTAGSTRAPPTSADTINQGSSYYASAEVVARSGLQNGGAAGGAGAGAGGLASYASAPSSYASAIPSSLAPSSGLHSYAAGAVARGSPSTTAGNGVYTPPAGELSSF